MSTSVVLPWDDALIDYDFGPTHPLNPLASTSPCGWPARSGCSTSTTCPIVTMEPAPTTTCSAGARGRLRRRGQGRAARTRRSPTSPAVSAPRTPRPSRACTRRRALVVGRHRRRGPRGLDRARPSTPSTSPAACTTRCPAPRSGFCVYNDPAIAIAWLLEQGAERIAYVDVDVHHGDGVERVFWDDPRVLTISVHESGPLPVPRHRVPRRRRRPRRRGLRRQRRAAARHERRAWLRAFHAVVPPLLEEFRPDVLVTQHGCDSHLLDPLAHLGAHRRRAAHVVRRCCTTWRTTTPAAGGSPPAAAATSSSQVVPRAWTPPDRRGRRQRRSPPETPVPRAGGSTSPSAYGAGRAAADDRRRDADLAALVATATTRPTRSTGPCWPPRRAVFPAHGLGGLLGL